MLIGDTQAPPLLVPMRLSNGNQVASGLFSLVLLTSTVRAVLAEETLSSISEIRALSPDDADKHHDVRVTATVTLYNPTNGDLIITNGSEGMFVLKPELPVGVKTLVPGDQVVVSGTTVFGGFIAAIEKSRVLSVSPGSLPPPRQLTSEELFSPSLTLSWAEIPAVIVGTEPGSEFFTLVAQIDGWTWRIMLPPNPRNEPEAARLMQRSVLIRGVVGSTFNQQAQMTGRLLYVQSFDQITNTESKESSVSQSSPVVPIDHLLLHDSKPHALVKVQGIVTYTDGDQIFLRGQGGSLLVHALAAENLGIGDSVEAEGFAEVAPFRPAFRAFRTTKMGSGTAPQPLPMVFTTEGLPTLQDELVRVDAVLLGVAESHEGRILQCRNGESFFEAILPQRVDTNADLKPGSKLRLSGICELEPEVRDLTLEDVRHVRVVLRDKSDLEIIMPAPWWTVERMFWALGIISSVTAGAFLWVFILRRRVAAQTELIGQRIKKEATLEERQRVARELHDSIEQQLAGLSIQLGSTRRRLVQGPQDAEKALELALSMLRHCREDIHTSVGDLRSVALEQRGLSGAIEELLAPALKESGTNFSVNVVGTPRPLGQVPETHLLRIAQEAVANAAKHANAKHISVTLTYRVENLALEVRDDGSGFAPETSPPRGHFGLIGIRERADKLGATLAITSSAGSGTTLLVLLPSQSSPSNLPA